MQATQQRVATREEWIQARKELLAREKEWTRLRDTLSEARRALPWVKLEKSYTFDTTKGPRTLGQLFDGRSQLMVYHFMLGPEEKEGCPSCSMIADAFDSTIVHLRQRDVTLIAASRSPLANIEAFRKRLGWQFTWVSSHANDFNFDFGVSFTPEQLAGRVQYNYQDTSWRGVEAPGFSVFGKNAQGEIFHTYSTYGRGLEMLLPVYSLLDFAPHGRQEEGLVMSMAWVRHHDRYEDVQAASCSHCEGP